MLLLHAVGDMQGANGSAPYARRFCVSPAAASRIPSSVKSL